MRLAKLFRISFLVALCCVVAAQAARAGQEDAWRVDYQITNVTQWHPRFRSPYEGPNSLTSRGRAEETTDITAFVGYRLGERTELWLNPEIDQGFGLRNTVGVAGFTSGEAYKVGQNRPYVRLPRAFVRHVVNLGGSSEPVESGLNQFAGTRASDNLVFTVGKFAVVDVFDTNTYAHDPRADFLNWSILDGGAFDYAADSWGYTLGAAAEWNAGAWSLRGGLFTLSNDPNGRVTGLHPSQRAGIAELEHRHELAGQPGKLKFLVFANRAKMARYDDAVAQGELTGQVPDVAVVRAYRTNPGWVFGLEQQLTADLGVFGRVSANSGKYEAYEFTEINRSVSAGMSLKGGAWYRGQDVVGVAAATNGLSGSARRYFAAGGIGILIGDGQLNYARERIVEAYYSAHLLKGAAISFNVQRVWNPAYNSDRGPVWVYGTRVHVEF